MDRLEVGECDDQQQPCDRHANSPGQRQPRSAGHDESEEDLLIGVRNGGQGIGRESSQRPHIVQALGPQPSRWQRRSDEQIPELLQLTLLPSEASEIAIIILARPGIRSKKVFPLEP